MCKHILSQSMKVLSELYLPNVITKTNNKATGKHKIMSSRDTSETALNFIQDFVILGTKHSTKH